MDEKNQLCARLCNKPDGFLRRSLLLYLIAAAIFNPALFEVNWVFKVIPPIYISDKMFIYIDGKDSFKRY